MKSSAVHRKPARSGRAAATIVGHNIWPVRPQRLLCGFSRTIGANCLPRFACVAHVSALVWKEVRVSLV